MKIQVRNWRPLVRTFDDLYEFDANGKFLKKIEIDAPEKTSYDPQKELLVVKKTENKNVQRRFYLSTFFITSWNKFLFMSDRHGDSKRGDKKCILFWNHVIWPEIESCHFFFERNPVVGVGKRLLLQTSAYNIIENKVYITDTELKRISKTLTPDSGVSVSGNKNQKTKILKNGRIFYPGFSESPGS